MLRFPCSIEKRSPIVQARLAENLPQALSPPNDEQGWLTENFTRKLAKPPPVSQAVPCHAGSLQQSLATSCWPNRLSWRSSQMNLPPNVPNQRQQITSNLAPATFIRPLRWGCWAVAAPNLPSSEQGDIR